MLGALSVGFVANLHSRLRHGVAAAARKYTALIISLPETNDTRSLGRKLQGLFRFIYL
jgi:hypothetical protein